MKKIYSLACLLMLCMACSEKDSIFTAEMNAQIDEVSWNTISRISVVEAGNISITGSSIDGRTLTITIFGDSEDIYQVGSGSGKCAAVYKESASASLDDTFIAVSGEVELTSIDEVKKEISGTFNFSVIRNVTTVVTITKGKFNNLKYTGTDI